MHPNKICKSVLANTSRTVVSICQIKWWSPQLAMNSLATLDLKPSLSATSFVNIGKQDWNRARSKFFSMWPEPGVNRILP